MTGLDVAREKLREKFGFADFRPGQAEAIAAVLDGEDVVAIYPTGAGKSLIYQLPALMRPGLTLVVSPLIALMRDQVEKLRALGLPAGALHAGQDDADRKKITRDLQNGVLKLLYLAPERLALPETIDLLGEAGVKLLAVDEAHCVSHWGHDFRPDYLNIRSFAEKLGAPQMLALTATAAPATRADLIRHLFLRPPGLKAASLRRPNLRLAACSRKSDGWRQCLDFVAARPGQSGIIYCASRAGAERLADYLCGAGQPALAYHAGLPGPERARRQDLFVARADLVMTATIAFGLGVDKPDLRYILHKDPPETLESLYQESGRAGRDGKPAEAMALYVDRGPSPDAGCAEYFRTLACREVLMLAHFGESVAPCGQCDNCRRGRAAAGLLWLGRAARAPSRLAAGWLQGFFAPVPDASADEPAAPAAPWPAAEEVELTIQQRRRLARLLALRQNCAREARLSPARLLPHERLIGWARDFSGDDREKTRWEADFDNFCAAAEWESKSLRRRRDAFWREIAQDSA